MKAFLKAKDIYLRALCAEDETQEYTDWLNDSQTCLYNSHHRFANTLSKTKEYIEFVSNSRDNLVLAICENETHQHIGNIALQNINLIDSQAEFAILVGESSNHAKGVGTQAGELIIKHGFDAFNLHRIYCGTSAQNVPMQKLAKKLNFEQEGISKDALFKNGKYEDIINYALLNPNHKGH